MQFIFTKKDGRISISNFKSYLSHIGDGKYVVEVKKFVQSRTLAQNNYYWMYLDIIASETGHNRADLHEYFKHKFITDKEIKIFGDSIKVSGSTTKLSKSDFSKYIADIEQLTEIPAPNPEEYLNS